MKLVTAGQMQDMDRQTIEEFGIPGCVLMENAGRGAVEFFLDRFGHDTARRVAVIAGRGNNGGDGFVMARYLIEKGFSVNTFLLSQKETVKGDARTNMDLAQKLCDRSDTSAIIEIPDAAALTKQKSVILHHDLFIDALLGTGLNSDVRGFFKEAIEMMNASPCPVFSVDIPSGLNSDTGRPMGTAVRADATATFAFAKAGHVLYPGNLHTGQLKVIDIGIPDHIAREKRIGLSLMDKKTIAACFTPRSFESHKGSYGHLLVIAGSRGKTGAAALCANAAMRCGTGLVTLGVAQSLNPQMEPQVLEPMTHPLPETEEGCLTAACLGDILALLEGKQALAMGPGLGTRPGTADLVKALVRNCTVPMVIDADGINCIADNPGILKQKKAPAILTPHPGEMARLCGTDTQAIQSDRIRAASGFAKEHDAIMILKGAQTIVSFPDGRSHVCPTGNPGMASAGMGDVLTGMAAGFVSQGLSLEDAATASVYIHGLCADILSEKKGTFGFLASDMIPHIPETIHHHLI